MQKPNNYEAVQTEFVPVELGGHYAVIKRVEETQSKTGKPMVKIAFDFDGNDKQPGYFMNSFKNDTREDKKWPFQATHYILTEDQSGACNRSFKAFITSLERSNNSQCVWGDGFEKWCSGKKIGVVFGEQEEEYNGEVKTRRRIRYFCEYSKVPTMLAPDKRLLNNRPMQPAAKPLGSDPTFMQIADTDDEVIPF